MPEAARFVSAQVPTQVCPKLLGLVDTRVPSRVTGIPKTTGFGGYPGTYPSIPETTRFGGYPGTYLNMPETNSCGGYPGTYPSMPKTRACSGPVVRAGPGQFDN